MPRTALHRPNRQALWQQLAVVEAAALHSFGVSADFLCSRQAQKTADGMFSTSLPGVKSVHWEVCARWVGHLEPCWPRSQPRAELVRQLLDLTPAEAAFLD